MSVTPKIELARPRQERLFQANADPNKAFKILTAAKIRRLCSELTPAALKVWLYHFGRSNKQDTSYPNLETIAVETNQNIQTVKHARKWLRENGWLVTEGRRRAGQFSASVERCAFPHAPRVVFPPVEKGPQVEKPSTVFPPTEVDSTIFEVGDADSPVEVLEIGKQGGRGESSSPAPAAQKSDDDSALRPDFDSIESRIQKHMYNAKKMLLKRGHVEHFVDAALQYIVERSDYSGTVPSSSNYFITAFENALADPSDRDKITRRAELRARVMLTGSELLARADELQHEAKSSGCSIKDVLEAKRPAAADSQAIVAVAQTVVAEPRAMAAVAGCGYGSSGRHKTNFERSAEITEAAIRKVFFGGRA